MMELAVQPSTTSIFDINHQILFFIAYIHKSQFVSWGFNKVWDPLPLTLNKIKEKLQKKNFQQVKIM